MDSNRYDLLYGGAYSIKDYYMESGNPRQMRGASELLNDCSETVRQHLLGINGVSEKHIIASGATLSAKVPQGMGEELVKYAEGVYRKKCRTAGAAFVSVPFDGNYVTTKRRALAKYDSRRAAKFTSLDFLDAEEDEDPENKTITKGNFLKYTSGDPCSTIVKNAPVRCPRCRIRSPKYYICHDNEEELYLCTSCAQREHESGEEKYVMRKKCIDKDKYNYEINTMTDLADSDGRVALLYADVNNLGGQEKAEFEDDWKLHESVKTAITSVVSKAINATMNARARNEGGEIKAKFEIIALGGDDICLLMPGDVALLTSKAIAEGFDKASLGLTISLAACVANDTTAITYVESIVENALKSAKKYARKSGQSVVSLSFFERPDGLFPMTVNEVDGFSGLLKEISKGGSSVTVTALRNIAEARRELVFDEEFDLFLKYYLSRDISETINSRPAIEKTQDYIKKKYESDKKWNPDKLKTSRYSWYSWSDFVTWRGQKLGGDE